MLSNRIKMDAYSDISSRWTDEEGNLFEYSAQAPPPSKDFCQVVVTLSQVIFRWWKITHRNSESQRLRPGEIKECHEDFLLDDRTQNMILLAFGQSTLDYIINLCHGHVDCLPRLPESVIKKILLNVELEDIARVSLLNKFFHKICNDDDLWKSLFGSATTITDDLEDLAKDQGWKKLFFSNKLQIQMQLQRKRKTEAEKTPKEEGKKFAHNYHDEVLSKH